MPAMKLADDLTRGDVERGEQRRGAMAFVVMRPPFDLPWSHGQKRLRTIQRLNLRLLVDTEERGAFGRIYR